MSKNYRPSADMPEQEAPKTFTTSEGVTIPLRPISPFKLDAMRMAKKEIPVPTYTVKTVGGEEQILPLDAISAENKGRTDEWNTYLKEKQEADSRFTKKFSEMVIWEGTNIEVPNGDSEWHKTNEYFGIKIPDNPVERKISYIYNELLRTQNDFVELVAAILSVSQLNEEAVQKLRDSFRSGIQRKANSGLPKKEGQMEGKKPNI